ncbi:MULTISPECIES: alpha/beta hydrolase [Burkholderia]|uniref:alpha/beta hydrolase n=1 Tax=Burkholderia TaxID=32008 RepID=UPI000DAB60C1|nr:MULTISPECIES: alpha/beta hydrolase [Burkholderia]MDP9547075.1 acetyl esterase [Burkholderia cepacia]MBR8265539.1 alpha/beta hydrolase [Burkholderia cenocepacia]MBR8349528.1 alpha/beta hydrolase [Burkholderia cenocepacia]MBR8388705.1 alpha/beta hydrolase [Burkholderia cenocepacia]MBR8468832.1 alpha/beta hydrolase [Burkholderia cenocepacia]
MALDLHLAGFLESFAGSGAKPLPQSTPEEARGLMLHLARAVRAPEAVVDLHRVEDLTVPGAAGSLRARLYRPSGERHLPTVVYLHGGGFVIGDLDTHDNICRELARGANAVVVSVDYRLAPEHRYPAGADDAIAATKWVIANAGELGGSDVVAVAGDSAGGNLAAVVTQQLHADGISLAAQFLIYPAVAGDRSGFPSFKENGEGYLLDVETIAWFERHYLSDGAHPEDARLAPIHAKNLAGLPPAVIVTAEYDPLRDEGEAYGRLLHASGVKVDTLRCDGMLHGFFDMGAISPGAQTWIDKGIARFRKVLDGAQHH